MRSGKLKQQSSRENSPLLLHKLKNQSSKEDLPSGGKIKKQGSKESSPASPRKLKHQSSKEDSTSSSPLLFSKFKHQDSNRSHDGSRDGSGEGDSPGLQGIPHLLLRTDSGTSSDNGEYAFLDFRLKDLTW